MKNSIIKIIVISFIIYNLIPLINNIIPESITYTFLTDLWIINSLWALISSNFFCKKYGFKIYIPLLLSIIFIPTMLIFYNSSAFIFAIVYCLLALIGSIIGGIIHYIKNKRNANTD